MAFDGRMRIEDIDDDERTVYFDTYKLKKMTGTRIGPIMGESEFSSPFKVACELAGLYPGDKPTKYIDAGNILEPVLRDYLGTHANSMLKGPLEIPEGSTASVEEPVPMEQCGYDHFHAEKLFGGLVDGYIKIDNVRDTILEIKTSGEVGGRERRIHQRADLLHVSGIPVRGALRSGQDRIPRWVLGGIRLRPSETVGPVP